MKLVVEIKHKGEDVPFKTLEPKLKEIIDRILEGVSDVIDFPADIEVKVNQ